MEVGNITRTDPPIQSYSPAKSPTSIFPLEVWKRIFNSLNLQSRSAFIKACRFFKDMAELMRIFKNTTPITLQFRQIFETPKSIPFHVQNNQIVFYANNGLETYDSDKDLKTRLEILKIPQYLTNKITPSVSAIDASGKETVILHSNTADVVVDRITGECHGVIVFDGTHYSISVHTAHPDKDGFLALMGSQGELVGIYHPNDSYKMRSIAINKPPPVSPKGLKINDCKNLALDTTHIFVGFQPGCIAAYNRENGALDYFAHLKEREFYGKLHNLMVTDNYVILASSTWSVDRVAIVISGFTVFDKKLNVLCERNMDRLPEDSFIRGCYLQGNSLFLGLQNSPILVYSIPEGKLKYTIGDEGNTSTTSFVVTERYIAIPDSSHIDIWDHQDNTFVQTLPVEGKIGELYFDDNRLVVALSNGKVQIWTLPKEPNLKALPTTTALPSTT